MSMYTEQYLEHYADRFVELDLYSHGVTLERYLFDPAGCEFAVFELRPILRADDAERAGSEPEASGLSVSVLRCHMCGTIAPKDERLSLLCNELQAANSGRL